MAPTKSARRSRAVVHSPNISKHELRTESRLELLAPVALNIVCFRYRAPEPDRLNADLVAELQERGIAAPSTTKIDGKLAIRVCLVNHRTQRHDIDAMVDAVLLLGGQAVA